MQSYRNNEALLDALCFHLDLRRHAPEGSEEARLNVEGFATTEDVELARWVAGIFRQVDLFFDTNPNGCFVIGLGKGLYLVEATDRGFRWTCNETEESLLDWLSQPRGRYSPPGCDSRTLTHSPLPIVFDKCQPGEQQLFYHCDDGRSKIYILDESGSLFDQELPTDDPRFLLMQQQRFLDSVARLRRLNGMAEEGASLITGPRFYRLEYAESSGWSALPVMMPRNEGVKEFLELRLVAESVGEDVRLLSLVCGDRQFSFLTLGDNLYRNVVKYILGFRRGGDYPIYLTAVEVIQVRYGIPPCGVELLVLKRRVERCLNETLRVGMGC